MKTKLVVAILTAASSLTLVSQGLAQATAVQSGNWSDPATWGGSVPLAGQAADVNTPYTVTVDQNETTFNLEGTGTVIMNPGVTLTNSADAPFSSFTGTFNASAVGCTVVLTGNPFNSIAASASIPNTFYNLTLAPGGSGGVYSRAPLYIAGTLTMIGNIFYNGGPNNGGPISMGSLDVESNAQFDCGGSAVTVTNWTLVNGSGPGANGNGIGTFPGGLNDTYGQTQALDDQFGTVTVTSNGVWFLGDVVEWAIGGSITNNGVIAYTNTGSARITFDGTGVVTGSPFQVPAISFYGTNTFLTSITNLVPDFFTNYSTVTFDLAHPAAIYDTPTNFVYGGNLNLINSGAPPPNNTVFPLFQAMSYAGSFVDITSSFNFVNNLSTSGSITFTGGSVPPPAPKITTFSYNRAVQQVTLTWSSTSGDPYSVHESGNLATPIGSWPTLTNNVNASSSSTTVTLGVSGTPGFFRVSSP